MNNESTITNKKDKRNYGIDLLKIIAMIYVVVLHTLGNGGILRNLEPGTHKYFVAWFLETFAFCAVDIFALVTGYISYREEERKNLFLNYTKLWIQVVFYCTILSIIFNIFNISVVRKETYIHNFLPVLTNQYWYFTAYTGVVILMPLLDEALRKLSNEKLKKIFILILIFFTASSIIKDNFGMSGGYTVIWLAVLYILGGIIKKCKIFNEIKSKYIVIAMIILFLSTYFYFILGKNIIISDINITALLSVSYISPTIVLISIGYLCIFSKIKLTNPMKKIVKFFSATTFSIYLLNSNRFIGDYLIKDKFIHYCNHKTIVLALKVIVFSLLFSILAMLIDKVRIIIFKKIKIEKLAKNITVCIEKIAQKIINLL